MRSTIVVALLLLTLPSAGIAQAPLSDADRREAFSNYRTGQELLASEQWQKAAAAFTAAIKIDRLFTDAHYGLGHAYMGLQRYASAAQAFAGAIEAARALHQLRERDRVAADRRIDDEIKELKDTVRRMASQPNRALRRQQLEQRIQDLERSRSSLGTMFEAPAAVLLALGSAHFRNGDQTGAAHYWTEAVKVNSRLGEAWNNLAVIHLRRGNKSEAEAAVRNAERAGFRVNPRLKEDIAGIREQGSGARDLAIR
jgi:tetratricopeptide (TPR) repeat protein